MAGRISIAVLLTAASCSGTRTGGDGDCQQCQRTCGKGLATFALVLTPPGCGSQCQTMFCPGGCASDGVTCLSTEVPDGGLSSCVASSLTASAGVFASQGVAVTQNGTVRLATSGAVACELASDAGLTSTGAQAAALIIGFPQDFGGTVDVTSGSLTAVLTTRSDGGLTRTAATSGNVTVSSQSDTGVFGSYSLQFGADTETGSFTAPACDVCATPP